MSFFTLKISNPEFEELVNEICAGSQSFVVEQLNQLKRKLVEGSYVFIQLGGDEVPWSKGLIGLAVILRGPFDIGYDRNNSRNFKLRLRMVVTLESVITREDFIPYLDSYDAAGIGPSTRGEQNQAIKEIEDKQAYTVLRAMADRQNELEETIRDLFRDSPEICDAVFGEIPYLFQTQISYSRSDNGVTRYEEKNVDERKDEFNEWMLKQTKRNGELYKVSTATNYSSSLRLDTAKLTDFDGEHTNLFYYTRASDFTTAMAQITSHPNFLLINSKGKGTFAAAMKKYCSFLLDLSMPDDESENEEENGTTDGFKLKRSNRKETLHPYNLILYGAPGTGKTYSTFRYAVEIIERKNIKSAVNNDQIFEKYNKHLDAGRIVFTTFHQNYGYEEFIQGLRPDPDSKELTFKTIDGHFKKIADKALKDPDKDYVIIIDEINRANISKVFGELITLIEDDKRWGQDHGMTLTLQSGEVFTVPNNLFIIGTMNSADKSISLIDAALRRRFDFKEIEPDSKLIKNNDLKKVLDNLNKHLAEQLHSSDLLIGHAYFMHKEPKDLPDILNNKIIPLLYEYFYDQREKVREAINAALKGNKSIRIKPDNNEIKRLCVEEISKSS